MADCAGSTLQAAAETVSAADAKPRFAWGRAAFFFLLGFLLLSEPLMLVLLLYKNGTFQS
jgi:hypothetical protein